VDITIKVGNQYDVGESLHYAVSHQDVP